ncbi:MAG: SSI family serine proteinase inhibitor [Mycobacteriales bacterium]
MEAVPQPDAPAQRWTLTCDPPGGTHPDATRACQDLAAQETPFAPLPADAVCTQVFAGPQTATVTGSYRGEQVDLRLSRTDGCRASQWDRLGALLPPAA